MSMMSAGLRSESEEPRQAEEELKGEEVGSGKQGKRKGGRGGT